MKPYILLFAAITFVLLSCKKAKNNNNVPVITFLSMSTDSVRDGSSKDTVSIKLRVVDGDGDIGNGEKSGVHDVYLKDSRTGEDLKFFFPEIPVGTITPDNGVNAVCTVNIYAALFLKLRLDHPNGDTLKYDIYVKDKAGNASNTVITNAIYIYP